MSLQRDLQRARFAQVGFVMRAYRESYVDASGRRGVSQEQLLQRMAEADGGEGARFSHATVSRWEAGSVRPSLDRMRTFGKALELSDTEVAGLILLAGLAPDFETAAEQIGMPVNGPAPVNDAEHDLTVGDNPTEGAEVPHTDGAVPPMRSALGLLAYRVLPLAVFVVALGYAFGAVGWSAPWMPVAYVCATVGVVLAQGLIRPDRTAGLRDFLWVSLFFVLAIPSLQFAFLDMDHYGFYRVGDLAGTHLPYMLALLVSLAAAGVSGVVFHTLSAWQNSTRGMTGSTISRAVWKVIPAVLASYAVVVVLSNVSVWIQSAVALAFIALVFIQMLVLRDPSVNPSQVQRRFLLHATFIAAFVCAILGLATILTIYLLPDVPRVLPNHNLLVWWEIDFDARGLTRQEALERLNPGYMWHALCMFLYMTLVVGGSVVTAVFRLSDGDDAGPDAVHAGVPGPVTAGEPGETPRVRPARWLRPVLAMVRWT